MHLQMIKKAVVFGIGRGTLLAQKYLPEIMLGVGIAGIPVATVLACKATLKIDEIKLEAAEKFIKIEAGKAQYDPSVYSEEDYKKDLTIVTAQTAVKIVKLYLPSAVVMIVSIGLITGGHYILNRRNAALVGAYKILDSGFKNYRQRVKELYGEDADTAARLNPKKVIIDEQEVDEINPTVKNSIVNIESEYARMFDSNSVYWRNDHDQNLFHIRNQELYANDQLNGRGHIFLNEVYDMLGLPRSKAGAVVGWVKDKSVKSVEIRVYEPTESEKNERVNGYSNPPFLLDFNVDGVIFDAI